MKCGGIKSMEALGQNYGYILYRSNILRTDPDSEYILYIDGNYRATYYRDRECEPFAFKVEGQ